MNGDSLATKNQPAHPAAGQATAEQLLAKADIRINGDRPWDMRVHNPATFDRALAYGSLGLGEAYMDGWWDAPRLDEFFHRLMRAKVDEAVQPLRLLLHSLRARLMNLQTARRAWQVAEQHYDLGNDFYEAMLDHRLTYTCGYWKEAANLDEAQTAKLDLICRKLQLQPGQRLLDIGCGWGSLMQYAAQHYGVECVGVTISKEQAALGEERCAGLPITFLVKDYRAVDQPFDRIASVGMFEHVGRKNYRTFMDVAQRCLTDDGLFLLHTIGKNRTNTPPDPWMNKYIFPNGDLPSLIQIANAAEPHFVLEDFHNFGADYDPTLMAWYANFEASWPKFQERYGERFYRMWRYYLLSCAGIFRARAIQLWQLVYAKDGLTGGYRRPA